MIVSTFILLKATDCQSIRGDLLTRLGKGLDDVQSGPGTVFFFLEKEGEGEADLITILEETQIDSSPPYSPQLKHRCPQMHF